MTSKKRLGVSPFYPGVRHYPLPDSRTTPLCDWGAGPRTLGEPYSIPTCEDCLWEIRRCYEDPDGIYTELVFMGEQLFRGSEL